MNGFLERDKTCMECEEDCYQKQLRLHGWYGSIQRQLQRSQYGMRYSKTVQAVIWILLLLFLIGNESSSLCKLLRKQSLHPLTSEIGLFCDCSGSYSAYIVGDRYGILPVHSSRVFFE